jgi:hypothetical protein
LLRGKEGRNQETMSKLDGDGWAEEGVGELLVKVNFLMMIMNE